MKKYKILIIFVCLIWVILIGFAIGSSTPEPTKQVKKEVESTTIIKPSPSPKTSAQIEAEKKKKEEDNKKKKEQERLNKIKAQFSVWDGSHTKFKEFIKNNMNDPDSFKHVETRYSDNKTFILVSTKFKGTNTFGGIVTNTMMAKYSIDGDFIEVIE